MHTADRLVLTLYGLRPSDTDLEREMREFSLDTPGLSVGYCSVGGKVVSAFNLTPNGSTRALFAPLEEGVLKYLVSAVLIGDEPISEWDATPFKGMRLEIPGLHLWMRETLFEGIQSRRGGRQILSFSLRKELATLEIENVGTLELVVFMRGDSDAFKLQTFEPVGQVTLRAAPNRSAAWYYRQALRLNQLFTLLTGLPVAYASFDLEGFSFEQIGRRTKRYDTFKVIVPSAPKPDLEAWRNGGDNLLCRRPEINDLDTIVSAFLNAPDDLRAPLDSLHAALTNPKVELEIKFVQLVGVLEALERDAGTYMDPQDYQGKITGLIAAIPADLEEPIRLKLEDAITRANSKSVRSKLEKLSKRVYGRFALRTDLKAKDLAAIVSDNRNFLTHHDPRGKRLLYKFNSTLNRLCRYVRYLAQYRTLERLGMSEELRDRMLSRQLALDKAFSLKKSEFGPRTLEESE